MSGAAIKWRPDDATLITRLEARDLLRGTARWRSSTSHRSHVPSAESNCNSHLLRHVAFSWTRLSLFRCDRQHYMLEVVVVEWYHERTVLPSAECKTHEHCAGGTPLQRSEFNGVEEQVWSLWSRARHREMRRRVEHDVTPSKNWLGRPMVEGNKIYMGGERKRV